MFLPVVPTTVFLIIAAILFARSHPEWEARIMNHPKFGPPVRAFRETGAIPPKAKLAAVTAMTISSIVSWFLLDGWLAYLPAAVCALCAAYILTRPSH